MVQGHPLTESDKNANSGCWTLMLRPHSSTPTRAASVIITQPAPRDKDSTKPRSLTDLNRGQGTPYTLLIPHSTGFFIPGNVFVCFVLIDLIFVASLGVMFQGLAGSGKVWAPYNEDSGPTIKLVE